MRRIHKNPSILLSSGLQLCLHENKITWNLLFFIFIIFTGRSLLQLEIWVSTAVTPDPGSQLLILIGCHCTRCVTRCERVNKRKSQIFSKCLTSQCGILRFYVTLDPVNDISNIFPDHVSSVLSKGKPKNAIKHISFQLFHTRLVSNLIGFFRVSVLKKRSCH